MTLFEIGTNPREGGVQGRGGKYRDGPVEPGLAGAHWCRGAARADKAHGNGHEQCGDESRAHQHISAQPTR